MANVKNFIIQYFTDIKRGDSVDTPRYIITEFTDGEITERIDYNKEQLEYLLKVSGLTMDDVKTERIRRTWLSRHKKGIISIVLVAGLALGGVNLLHPNDIKGNTIPTPAPTPTLSANVTPAPDPLSTLGITVTPTPTPTPTMSAADLFKQDTAAIFDQVKASGAGIDEQTIIDIQAMAMGIIPDHIVDNGSFFKSINEPVATIFNTNVQSKNNVAGIGELTDTRKPIDSLSKIFNNNQTDKKFFDHFLKQREAILDAVYKDDKETAAKLSETMFIDIDKAFSHLDPIKVSTGELIGVRDVSPFCGYLTVSCVKHFLPAELQEFVSSISYESKDGSLVKCYYPTVEKDVTVLWEEKYKDMVGIVKSKSGIPCPEEMKGMIK